METENTELIYKLGRQYIPDERDQNYLISTHLLKRTSRTRITSRYWDDTVWWGDQGNTPQCVGYAWSHWLSDGPVYHRGPAPKLQPNLTALLLVVLSICCTKILGLPSIIFMDLFDLLMKL